MKKENINISLQKTITVLKEKLNIKQSNANELKENILQVKDDNKNNKINIDSDKELSIKELNQKNEELRKKLALFPFEL